MEGGNVAKGRDQKILTDLSRQVTTSEPRGRKKEGTGKRTPLRGPQKLNEGIRKGKKL